MESEIYGIRDIWNKTDIQLGRDSVKNEGVRIEKNLRLGS
jgi:hypothetical protein